ncbi:STAM-binding protein [Clonorchis sinensis]|uniref:STAM-binding protein n=1 Tax=Clonorchis sinensis TaxID=79923 RepID=H2KPP3_CLOSI|nr:STAM-binding protein [Clonorchis sinensis]
MTSTHHAPKACRTPEARLAYLMDVASRIDFFHGLDIQQYFRVMRAMISTVEMYIQTNQKESAYVLASKFVILYLQHLPKHREYNSLTGTEKSEWNARCRKLLNRAEALKAELRERYESEYREYLEEEKARQAKEEARRAEEEAERCRLAEKARLEQEKRASVLGTLVPKAPPSTMLYDGLNNDRASRVSLPSYPTEGGLAIHGSLPVNLSTLLPPAVDRSSKPASVRTNERGWATVRISPNLAQKFLQLADLNSKNNMETCGSLCGRVVSGEFHITDLVLPKQSGTPDSCTTYKEEELFEYTEKRNLLVLGWIHTHPSQTAFLSSVDQHTQLSYQIMLPEAIAIVCSPKFDEIKTFSLTPDHGIPFVRQCKQIGFHPHPQTSPLFEDSKHVVYDSSLLFNVIDLR